MKIEKTVKLESVKLSSDEFLILDRLFNKCLKCKNDLYQRFSGINSLKKIQNSKTLRQTLRPLKLEYKYNFVQRFWIMLLFDVCANVKSSWSNLANLLKSVVRENNNLTDKEKAYLYYVLSAPKIWADILTRNEFTPNNKLIELGENLDLHKLHNYLCRTTRKHKFKTPKAKILNTISFDQEMYTIKDLDNGKSAISLSTDVPNERLTINLKSKYCYNKKGNIILKFNRDKKCIEIHKLIYVKSKENKNTNIIGVDKGYATLLSCSDDTEYGINIGEIFTKEAQRLNKKNTNRNYFISKNIKIGNKTYRKQHRKSKQTVAKEINYAIKQMIKTSNPIVIVKEKLDPRGNTGKGKFFNRIISNWTNGLLNERLEYLCLLNGIKTIDINPAYTSKYCNKCNAMLIERTGKHHEVGICPNCGNINANTNAAKNILTRKDDEEITIYTPYKKVKEILDLRVTN